MEGALEAMTRREFLRGGERSTGAVPVTGLAGLKLLGLIPISIFVLVGLVAWRAVTQVSAKRA
jgi:hypothetical protein